jgi:hypothetical protein
VRLEFDVERTDQYGRTLAYIWKDGSLFNRVLVERGFAQVTIFPPDDKYADRLRAAENRARGADNGAWGICPYFGSPATGGRGDSSDSNDSVAEGKLRPQLPGGLHPSVSARSRLQRGVGKRLPIDRIRPPRFRR